MCEFPAIELVVKIGYNEVKGLRDAYINAMGCTVSMLFSIECLPITAILTRKGVLKTRTHMHIPPSKFGNLI